MQERSPTFVFGQVLSHVTGEKNVAAVAAIHHPLCRVDAASGYVGAFVHVHYTTDRPAVNTHPDLQALIVLQSAADLKGTLRRFLRTLVEHQRHAVPGGNLQDPIGRFSFLKSLGQMNNLVELLNSRVLLVNGELRITDNVDEENVRNLQLDLLFYFNRHISAQMGASERYGLDSTVDSRE